MKRIPFTIEDWKAGGVPVTRSGEYVKQLTYFEGTDSGYPLTGVMGNSIDFWEYSGSYSVGEHPKDIFLEVPCTKYYTHYYRDDSGEIFAAVSNNPVAGGTKFIKTVEVEL